MRLIKKYLTSIYKMKDLNEVDIILGIKVNKNERVYALCQSHYIVKMLMKLNHLQIKEASTPFDSSIKILENSGKSIAQLKYASVISSMMYSIHYILCQI